MKRLLLLSILIFASCAKEEITDTSLCVFGDCGVTLSIDQVSSPDAYVDANGFWNVPYTGSNYFTIVAQYDAISGSYINGAGPDITTEWDSNYWFTAIDGITMWSSLYNPLGSNYSANFTFAYASETVSRTVDLGEIDEMFNLSGRYLRDDSLGPIPTTKSNVQYKSKKPYIFIEGMRGDTLTVYTNTSYAGELEIEKSMNVILK